MSLLIRVTEVTDGTDLTAVPDVANGTACTEDTGGGVLGHG